MTYKFRNTSTADLDPMVAAYLEELWAQKASKPSTAKPKRAPSKRKAAAPAPQPAPMASAPAEPDPVPTTPPPAKSLASGINAEAQARSGYGPSSPIWGVTIAAICDSLERAAYSSDEHALRKEVAEVAQNLRRREDYNAIKAQLWAKHKSSR